MDVNETISNKSRNKVVAFSIVIITFICGDGAIADDRISLPLINIGFTNVYFIYFGFLSWWLFEFWRFKQQGRYIFDNKLLEYARKKNFKAGYFYSLFEEIKSKGWKSKCNITTSFESGFIYKAQLRGMGDANEMIVDLDKVNKVIEESEIKDIDVHFVKSSKFGRGSGNIEQVNISIDLKNYKEGRNFINKVKKLYKTREPEFISDRLPDYLYYLTCYTITLKVASVAIYWYI